MDELFRVVKEAYDLSKPPSDINREYWWLYFRGKRVQGLHSEKEAMDHLETGEAVLDGTGFLDAPRTIEEAKNRLSVLNARKGALHKQIQLRNIKTTAFTGTEELILDLEDVNREIALLRDWLNGARKTEEHKQVDRQTQQAELKKLAIEANLRAAELKSQRISERTFILAAKPLLQEGKAQEALELLHRICPWAFFEQNER